MFFTIFSGIFAFDIQISQDTFIGLKKLLNTQSF